MSEEPAHSETPDAVASASSPTPSAGEANMQSAPTSPAVLPAQSDEPVPAALPPATSAPTTPVPSSSRASYTPTLPSYESLTAPLRPEETSDLPDDPLLQHAFAHQNLPCGYFLVRNRGTGRVLDVRGGRNVAGTEVCLYPVKDLHGNLADVRNNQLWFLDWSGRLCSTSGLHVDVVDGQLCLAAPSPIASRPTAHVHAPPVFRLDPVTRVLSVYTRTDEGQVDETMDTILEAVPQRADPSEAAGIAAAPQAVFGAISSLFSFGGGSSAVASKALPPLPEDSGPLRSPSMAEGGEDEEDPQASEDSSTAPMRAIRTLCLPSASWREKLPDSLMGVGPPTGSATERLWLRRQFDAVPVLVRGHRPEPPALPPRRPSSTSASALSSPGLPRRRTESSASALPSPPLPAPPAPVQPSEADAVPIEVTDQLEIVQLDDPTPAAGSASGA